MQEINSDTKVFLYGIFYVSLLFMLAFAFYGVKTNIGDTCSSNTISSVDSGTTKKLTNNNTHTVYIIPPDDYTQNLDSINICLDLKTNTSTYATVYINGMVQYVNNQTSDYACVKVADYNNTVSFYCEDCNITKALVVGRSTETGLHIDGSVQIASLENYRITFIERCIEFYKDLMQYYFIALALIIGIFGGYRIGVWFKGWLFNW